MVALAPERKQEVDRGLYNDSATTALLCRLADTATDCFIGVAVRLLRSELIKADQDVEKPAAHSDHHRRNKQRVNLRVRQPQRGPSAAISGEARRTSVAYSQSICAASRCGEGRAAMAASTLASRPAESNASRACRMETIAGTTGRIRHGDRFLLTRGRVDAKCGGHDTTSRKA